MSKIIDNVIHKQLSIMQARHTTQTQNVVTSTLPNIGSCITAGKW